MTNYHDEEQTAAATAAMNRVLEAEREAEQAVAECELNAQALLQAAYARARRLHSRTDERISHLRLRAGEHVTRQIEALERAEGAAQQESPPAPPAARLAAVVAELAAELSGGAYPSAPAGEAEP